MKVAGKKQRGKTRALVYDKVEKRGFRNEEQRKWFSIIWLEAKQGGGY